MQSLGVGTGDDAAATWGAPSAGAESYLQHQQPSSFAPVLEQPFGAAQQQQHTVVQQPFGAAQPQHAAMQQVQQAQQAPQQLPPGAAAGLEQGEMAFTGLQNEAGEYNCFLNVIIQCLWRCTDFRQLVGPNSCLLRPPRLVRCCCAWRCGARTRTIRVDPCGGRFLRVVADTKPGISLPLRRQWCARCCRQVCPTLVDPQLALTPLPPPSLHRSCLGPQP